MTPEHLLNLIGHEHRFEALVGMMPKITDPLQWWKLVRHAWTTSELLTPHQDEIRAVFAHHGDFCHMMMNAGERSKLRSLPDDLIVYRGTQFPDAPGWSWSLDRERADWFATRFPINGEAYTVEKSIGKDWVIALLDGRNESEVILDPDCSFDWRTITNHGPQEWTTGKEVQYLARIGQLHVGAYPIVSASQERGMRNFIEALREWGLNEMADRERDKLVEGKKLGELIATAKAGMVES